MIDSPVACQCPPAPAYDGICLPATPVSGLPERAGIAAPGDGLSNHFNFLFLIIFTSANQQAK